MNKCYLSLGCNQKNPERQIRLALVSIKSIPFTSLLKTSKLYWTKAWGLETQQNFCNAVVEITTSLTPNTLLNYCQMIEKKLGRVRKKKWGPRAMDIDIILYGNRVINTSQLTVPHPYYQVREFVLVPLLEINPLLYTKFNLL